MLMFAVIFLCDVILNINHHQEQCKKKKNNQHRKLLLNYIEYVC